MRCSVGFPPRLHKLFKFLAGFVDFFDDGIELFLDVFDLHNIDHTERHDNGQNHHKEHTKNHAQHIILRKSNQ